MSGINYTAGETKPGNINEVPQVNKIVVRMYRPGTGDFFLLLFKADDKVTFKMLIDCGCINAGKNTFRPYIEDLFLATDGEIDVLVVTHEHADHINGFKLASEQFRKSIRFKKVWFAWTESNEDPTAIDYRKNHTKVKQALSSAANTLNALARDGYFRRQFQGFSNQQVMVEAQHHFINSVSELNALTNLSVTKTGQTQTMEDFLKDNKVIDESLEPECFPPGKTISEEPGAKGIRFFILGPPKDLKYLSKEEKKDDGYSQREKPGSIDLAFISAFASENKSGLLPFKKIYEVEGNEKPLIKEYNDDKNSWRKIDHDWLYSSGNLALRFEKSINNTSLAFAIQFEKSERILLFTGDAEYGNWASWHDGLTWEIKKGGKSKKVNAKYILKNVVFYKVGHHLSQNGTAKKVGFEMMSSSDLVAMVSLDYKKINKGWLNTMPNDELGASLLRKTNGRLFFAGDYNKILKNIKTKRVSVYQTDENACTTLNSAFDNKLYIEYEITG
jgi:hypothetical protein